METNNVQDRTPQPGTLSPTELAASSDPLSKLSGLDLSKFESNELGQVQELLFGSHLQLITEHLQSLTQQTQQQLASIRQDYRSQIEQLRNQLHSDMDKIRVDLVHNAAQSTENMKNGEAKLDEVKGHLVSQLSELDSRLVSEIKTSNELTKKRSDDAVRDLHDKKIDQASLASLLGNLAEQLEGQSSVLSSPISKSEST